MFLKKKMILFPNTLIFRLTFWYTLVVVILISSAFGLSYFLLQQTLYQNVEEDLLEDVIEYQEIFHNEGLNGIEQELIRDARATDEKINFFQFFDKNANRIYSSNLSNWQFLPENLDTIKQVFFNKKDIFKTLDVRGEDYQVKTIFTLIDPNVLLYMGESTEEVHEVMELLLNVFIALLIIVIPFAFIISWLMARRAVKGIKEVSRIASEIERGKLDRRVSVSAQGDEITQLVNTFNSMLDRIWVLISEMNEMTDNITHDLRSPLARIRVISEQLLSNDDTPQKYKTAASDTIEECDRLLQMINSMLDVAEAEAGIIQISKLKVNMTQLVQDACELFEAIAEQKEIKFNCYLQDDCYTYGNIHNLQRMLANLLDNAIKYTPNNGQVEIILTCTSQHIKIAVQDTGMGIPEGDQVKVFDRFFRCDQSRTHDGCGLGLSFSRAVARTHRGDIKLLSRLENGSCFTVTLPVVI